MFKQWRASLSGLSLRQRALACAVLLMAVSGGYLLWTDADEAAVIVQNVETTPPSLEITGLSAAAARTPLRNPFSAAHERAGENTEEGSHKAMDERRALTSASSVHGAAPAVSLPPADPAPPAPPPLVLRGVVQNADGASVVILAEGTEGAALGVGDVWHGYTLRSVTDRSATLDAPSGTITLTRE